MPGKTVQRDVSTTLEQSVSLLASIDEGVAGLFSAGVLILLNLSKR